MSRVDNFELFALGATTGMMVGLREMAGATFTEHDRDSMVDGLRIIRTALVQPVGLRASGRVGGAVSAQEVDRAYMQVVLSAMQLWTSGKLGEVECDVE